MTDEILEKMKKGVYYPGNHLGKRQKLEDLVEKGQPIIGRAHIIAWTAPFFADRTVNPITA